MLAVCLPLFRVQANANALDEMTVRMEKVKELGLEEWVDEEGYLRDSYLEGKSDRELSEAGVDGLIRTMTKEEVDTFVTRIQMGIQTFAVTRYEKVSQVNPDTGGTLYTGIFEVDGKLAFCIERSVATPPKDSPTGKPEEVKNDKIRKVLYYGYHGPKDQGYTYVETALAAGEANGDGDNSLGRKVLAEILRLESPPEEFHVWKVQTNGGKTQDLVYYTMEDKAILKLKKVSAKDEMTSGNDCYSLAGAVYGIYSDAACQNCVKQVTTMQNGTTEEVEVKEGRYYVKELSAPPGYLLNEEIQTVQVKSGATTEVVLKDMPKTISPQILIRKVDTETGESKPQGYGTLAGAQFQVRFYGGDYSESMKPMKEWVFQTDEEGKVLLEERYKISGDSLWTALPYGTITIQEIKASEGYRICPYVYVKKLSDTEVVYQEPVVEEEIIQVSLLKYYEKETQCVPGITFLYEAPDGSQKKFMTDEQGKITIKGLQKGIHRLKEIETTSEYLLNENEIVFEVNDKNEIAVVSEVNEKSGKVDTRIDENGNLHIKVENKSAFFRLVLWKENEHEKRLEGAEFAIYADQTCTEEVMRGKTNADGKLIFEKLRCKTKYYLKEIGAPEGYEDSEQTLYEVYSDGSDLQREIQMTILNQIGMKLPETGSEGGFLLMMCGLSCMFLAIRKEKEHI